MNRRGQTTGFKVSDYLEEIVRFIGEDIFDHILVNNQPPPQELIEVYSEEGQIVENDLQDSRVIASPLLGGAREIPKKDLLKRSLIRHDCKKLAQELIKIVNCL
jgi:2-phospho-L-lactate transferase/gluconeogenesis factor (CofD/UPF0052 family)